MTRKDDTVDEISIQKALGKHLFLQNICIPNVLMYQKGHKEYEADLIYFGRKSNYLTEVEIKIDIYDFRADFKKRIITIILMLDSYIMQCQQNYI